MATRTIKVTGVSDDLLKQLDERVKAQHALGRSEYVRELIRKDILLSGPTFRELLAPVHAETARLGLSEADVDQLVEEARSARAAASADPLAR